MRMQLRRNLVIVFASFMALLASVSLAAAQGGDPLCPELDIEGVISGLGTVCANPASGEICYGHELVEVMSISGADFPSGAFDSVGDRLPVNDVARITTSPLDTSVDPFTWGLSLIQIDAYTGMNAQTGEPETAELRYIVPGGVELEAVNEPVLDGDGNPILDDLNPAPLQEIYLRNTFDDPVCGEAIPPFLLVQSEPGEVIDIVVNDEPIRLEGSAVIEILDDETMRVTTLTGMVTLNAESPAPILIPPAFFSEICLLDPDDLGLDGEANDQPVGDCDWTEADSMDADDLDRLEPLEGLTTNVVFTEIQIPAIVQPSGVGQPPSSFIFANQEVLQQAQEACAAGLIDEEICDSLQLTFTASICPEIVDPVLVGLGENCLTIDSGLVCYGNVSVDGLPIEGLQFSTPFATPGDIVSAAEVARLITADFDPTGPIWGFSRVKLDAYVGMDENNLPQTAELVYLLTGGVELEGAVAPTYDADGNLVLDDDHLAPLQQAYLRLSGATPACANAMPPALIVQSQSGRPVDFYMNGALIRLDGTAVLDLISAGETGQMLRMAVVDGQATVNMGSTAEQNVLIGFETWVSLNLAENLGLDLTENDRATGQFVWSESRPLTRAGLDRLQALGSLPQ